MGSAANLGAPATVAAVGGTFGSPTGTSGTVELRRSGATPRTIPASEVAWSSAAVTFVVPADLPVSPAEQAWDVTVTPAGAPPCGPYRLNVLAVPVLLFVPPVSVSERRLDVVANGIGGNAEVRFYDGTGRRIPHNIPPAQRTGLACQMPTIRELMDSGSTQIDPNQLTMRLQVTVYDPDSGRETARSPLHETICTLPPPAVGPVNAATAEGRLIFGEGSRPAELGDQLSLEWVGAPSRGRITFHVLDPTLLDQLADLQQEIARQLDPADPDLTLTPGGPTVQALQALRLSGRPPRSIESWTEERIEATVPQGWKSGVILVWRDDLPSPPIVLPELPLPDLCKSGMLQSALRELVSLQAPSSLNPGQTLTAQLVPGPGAGAPSETARLVRDLVANGTVTLGSPTARWAARSRAHRRQGRSARRSRACPPRWSRASRSSRRSWPTSSAPGWGVRS